MRHIWPFPKLDSPPCRLKLAGWKLRCTQLLLHFANSLIPLVTLLCGRTCCHNVLFVATNFLWLNLSLGLCIRYHDNSRQGRFLLPPTLQPHPHPTPTPCSTVRGDCNKVIFKLLLSYPITVVSKLQVVSTWITWCAPGTGGHADGHGNASHKQNIVQIQVYNAVEPIGIPLYS